MTSTISTAWDFTTKSGGIWNFRQACQQAGVSRQRLNEAIRSGRLPAERGGGPGRPTHIRLEDLQAWYLSEGIPMPVEAIERSERLKPEEFTAFLEQFRHMMAMMTRLERTVEQAIERLERSQAQANAQGVAQLAAQLNTPTPPERSIQPHKTSKGPLLDREGVITRIRQAIDDEKKSYQQVADELNADGIATFSGKGTWQKGNIGRFYKGNKD